MDFSSQFSLYVSQVEQALKQHVPEATTRPAQLHEAMRYSLEAGGKRLRPVIALATAELFGVRHKAEAAGVALECIHTYSLIHDDLPCMDNDDLRRGRPTVHKAYDEATALLAGDALLTHAFTVLCTGYAMYPLIVSQLVRELADAAGSQRLIGGQMADLQMEKRSGATAEELDFIHLNKTAAMIEASFVMGGLCGGAKGEQIDHLRAAGRHVGLAFQIIDDILDVTSDSATLGKTAGKDLKADKTTYVKVHGLEAARRMAHEQTEAALQNLETLPGDKAFLTALIRSMETRIK